MFRRQLSTGLVVTVMRPEHAEQLEQLQVAVFPTLADEQRLKAAHYRRHVEMFADGQYVVLDGERVVGATTTIRRDVDFEHLRHRFDDVLDGGWLSTHQPEGRWLYGIDVGTHPEYRRRGIARALYAARHEAVRRLGLDGQVTVGMMSGYGAVKHQMSADEYYAGLLAGDITDPTVSTQRRIGFEPRGLIEDYLDDPVCDNYGVALVLPAHRDVHYE